MQIILIPLVATVIFGAFKWVLTPFFIFKSDDYGNPYRRFCKKCGQCQLGMQQFNRHYWVANGHIKNENCKCNDYVDND